MPTASTHIRDINKRLDWDLSVDGPRTLGGLIVEKLEAFLAANVALKIDNYVLEVLHIDDKVTQTVRGYALELMDK